MEKVMVTGGAGFIGSHLAKALAGRGYHVTIVDDLSTGKMENIENLLKEEGVEFVRGSILDLPLLQERSKGVKYVFHEAALARVPRSIDDPLSANAVNITGSLNVLLAARDNAVKKLVYASSSSVYGGSPVLPQKEALPPNPLSPYALTKLAAEYYCEMFGPLYGLDTVSLRYFNVYGPGQDPFSQYATAVAAFMGRLSRGLPPIIYGDGEQSRDMTYVADVVDANILAAESDAAGVYNIGSGRSYTINQLADRMIEITGKDVRPVYQEPRPGDPRQTLADISRAGSFGYQPKYDLDAGLRKVIEAFEG